MTARRIVIQHENITEEIPEAQSLLRNSGLIETFNTIDRGNYGFTIIGIRIMEILEVALSVFRETSKQMTNIILLERGEGFAQIHRLTADDIRFINLFSLYTMSIEAVEGCSALSKKNIKVNGHFKLNEVRDMVNIETGMLPKKIVKDYQKYLAFYRENSNPLRRVDNAEKILENVQAYFRLLANSVEKMASDSSYALYREALEETYVNILGKIYEGFHYSAEDYSENSELMDIAIDEIIGNKDYLAAACKLSRDIAGFDFRLWQNPKQINPVLFALGNPGCGKTVTAHAIGNYFLNFCKERRIRARFVIIRRTDWASSYQNASAQQLIDIFKRNILDYRGVVGVYWPDIDTAFAARGDAGLRNEEKNVLGAVFGLFDGTILPKNGQWFMMCDANFMNMDKATVSRITQDPYYVKGPESPEDFIKLFRDVKLRKHKEFLKASEEEWLQFGRMCIERQLSGRSIENISRKAAAMVEDFDYPPEYFTSNFEGKKEIIRQYSKLLSMDDILKMTSKYIEFERESEEKSARQRFKDRVEEITNYLSAEKFAREALSLTGQ